MEFVKDANIIPMPYTLISGSSTQWTYHNYLSVVLDDNQCRCGEFEVYPCARLHARTDVHSESEKLVGDIC